MIGSLHGRALDAIDPGAILLALGLWILLTGGSLLIVLRVILALPADHFDRGPEAQRPWTLRRIARNAAGVVIIAVGAVLSIPGVPGQGILTILVGVVLVDFPRRQRVERALLGRPGVLPALNRLRARFGRAPLRPPR